MFPAPEFFHSLTHTNPWPPGAPFRICLPNMPALYHQPQPTIHQHLSQTPCARASAVPSSILELEPYQTGPVHSLNVSKLPWAGDSLRN